jgi:uncharacterized BrkB/YihY/UPF0761 family membrane protein
MAMMSSFDKSYDHYKKRNALQGRMVALQITLLLMLLFIFSLGLVVLGQNLLSLLFTALAIKKCIHCLFAESAPLCPYSAHVLFGNFAHILLRACY